MELERALMLLQFCNFLVCLSQEVVGWFRRNLALKLSTYFIRFGDQGALRFLRSCRNGWNCRPWNCEICFAADIGHSGIGASQEDSYLERWWTVAWLRQGRLP